MEDHGDGNRIFQQETADEIYEWLEKEQVAGEAPGTEPPVMDEYLCLMQIK